MWDKEIMQTRQKRSRGKTVTKVSELGQLTEKPEQTQDPSWERWAKSGTR